MSSGLEWVAGRIQPAGHHTNKSELKLILVLVSDQCDIL